MARSAWQVASNAVYLWTIDQRTVSAVKLEAMRQTLNEAERAKVARFRFEQLQKTAVISRGSVRIILGNLLATPPRNDPIYNQYPRQACASPANVAFQCRPFW